MNSGYFPNRDDLASCRWFLSSPRFFRNAEKLLVCDHSWFPLEGPKRFMRAYVIVYTQEALSPKKPEFIDSFNHFLTPKNKKFIIIISLSKYNYAISDGGYLPQSQYL